jgi:ribosomal protein L16 Arg81 hydroxylase
MKLQIDLSSEEFDDKYDEKKPYLKRQALKEIFTLEEFEKILYVANPGAPYFKIRLQDEVDKKQYVEQVHRFGKVVNRINRYRFNSLMDRGATLIINEIEVHSLAIKKMCNQLSSLTGQEVKANAYYTLGENSTFGFHWDPHDVFSIQLIGSKKWTLYEPTVLNPIAMMTRADTGPDKSKNCVQISMEPGDMLYVPRGWWHNVEGSGVPTLHIAFGVQILHYANYIAWACKWLLREHEQCRKKIKLHRVDCEDLISAAQIAYKEISRPQNLKFFLEKVWYW